MVVFSYSINIERNISASVVFAAALLFAGVASTITSAMAGGSIMAGMFKEPYDIKDNHSRLGIGISLILAFVVILFSQDTFRALILSQMVLSIQLPFTIFMQIYLTSSKKVMGRYANSRYTAFLLIFFGLIVTVLNMLLFISFFK
jgi:manganese transport protein